VSAGAVRRIFLLFYPVYIRGQEKTVIVAAKSRQFTADETGKGQFLRGNRRRLSGKGVVRSTSSPKKEDASVPNLCMVRASGQGTWVRECCSGFGERVCQFISEKSSITGHPLEA